MLMSVNPGFGGQNFIPSSLEKIGALRRWLDDRGLETLIEVDGGINASTAAAVSDAGADVFVAGSAVFGSSDYKATLARLRALVDRPS